jgi:hypothetical protein
MTNISITFRKEVSIDLNAYYPSFSKKLREQIDDAIYALLSGAPKVPSKRQRISLTTTAQTYKVMYKKHAKPGTQVAAIMKDISIWDTVGDDSAHVDGKKLKAMVMKSATERGFKTVNSAFHNMVRDGYFVPVEK